MARLLIFTPTIGDQMRAETKASIEAQVTDIDYVWEVGYHNPYPGEKMRNVVAQYQRAWQMALDGGYDALLTVEDDMVIPANAMQTLYETNAPVVYGVYMLRHGTYTLNTWQYINNHALGMSLSLYPKELKAYIKQGWGQVCGVGWGCTLIRRHVLEQIEIRSDSTDAGDLAFARSCLGLGIKQIARFDVPCGHITPEGEILEPYKNGGIVSRVYCLQPVVVDVVGKSVPMRAGTYYSVPPDVANALARAGYVRITNDTADSTDDEGPSSEEVEAREQVDISKREMAIDPKASSRVTRKVPRRVKE